MASLQNGQFKKVADRVRVGARSLRRLPRTIPRQPVWAKVLMVMVPCVLICLPVYYFWPRGDSGPGPDDQRTGLHGASAVSETDSQVISNLLRGAWRGAAGLDQQHLAAQKESLEDGQRQILDDLATDHLQTSISATFGATELTVTIDNASGSQEYTGTWKLVQADASTLTLDVELSNRIGAQLKRELQFFVMPDSEVLVMPVAANPELVSCSPFFVFEKQVADDSTGLDVASLVELQDSELK